MRESKGPISASERVYARVKGSWNYRRESMEVHVKVRMKI